jgi:hypothetical protein
VGEVEVFVRFSDIFPVFVVRFVGRVEVFGPFSDSSPGFDVGFVGFRQFMVKGKAAASGSSSVDTTISTPFTSSAIGVTISRVDIGAAGDTTVPAPSSDVAGVGISSPYKFRAIE